MPSNLPSRGGVSDRPAGGGLLLTALIIASSLAAGAFLLARIRAESGHGPAPEPGPAPIVETPSHRVTPEMLESSTRLAETQVPDLRADASDGASYELRALSASSPLVLVFIKGGCPCSMSAQPFFNELHAAYGRGARFLGVIHGDLELARGWSREQRVPFPILADPEMQIIRAFRAENSAYVALISARGRVEGLWPGFSSGMLRELGARLALLTGAEERPLDVSAAPEDMYTGCPFDWSVGGP